MSNAVGDDEQGWLGGATQSLAAAMNTVAPLIAGALYVTVSHAAPYWLGAAIMVVAAVVVGRAHIANTAKREPTDEGADVPTALERADS